MHIFNNPSLFTEWDNNFIIGSITIVLADGTKCSDIQGRGKASVSVTSDDGITVTIVLKDALYMPTLQHSGIISVTHAIKEGKVFHFETKSSDRKAI